MASKVKQYYDVKFPFTIDNYDGHFIDLNNTLEGKVASEIAHVILTRKGTRIRKPEFGTDLIKYVFEPNHTDTWQGVKNEIVTSVSRFVPNVSINDIRVVQSNDERNVIYVRIDYSVIEGNNETNDSFVTEI